MQTKKRALKCVNPHPKKRKVSKVADATETIDLTSNNPSMNVADDK